MTTRAEMAERVKLHKSNGYLDSISLSYREKICRFRGEKLSGCSCGMDKYRCELIGIPVRTKARNGHVNDIVCGTQCAKFSPEGMMNGNEAE